MCSVIYVGKCKERQNQILTFVCSITIHTVIDYGIPIESKNLSFDLIDLLSGNSSFGINLQCCFRNKFQGGHLRTGKKVHKKLS